MSSQSTYGLGLDAGGTQTRWALVAGDGRVHAQGVAAALSGLQLHSAAGRAAMAQALAELADAARSQGAVAGRVAGLVAGVTGLGAEQADDMRGLLAAAMGLPPSAVQAMGDIELSCRAAFAPGAGCVVCAGTGSIAAFVDAQGVMHRVGGRGAVIDDAGGGHWIAREALRQVWRAEDESPGAWRSSPLAAALFDQMGGSDWAHTRQWVYGASRGELGLLALAVAQAAGSGDAGARELLNQAGRELARLVLALLRRHGPRPLALAGRVFDLDPCIAAALCAALPPEVAVQRLTQPAHEAAGRLAAVRAAP